MSEASTAHSPSAAADFAAAADAAVAELAAVRPFDVVVVTRMTDHAWTGLAARTTIQPSPVGRRVPVTRTACHHLLVDHHPVVVEDLRTHQDPALRSVAIQHRVSGYVGAALRRPDGRRLGSVCGFSSDPYDVSAADVVPLLAETAENLGRRLSTALDAAADERRAAHERTRHASVDGTGLPDRRGWTALLQAEDVRARQLGEDLGVVLIDVGRVRMMRGIRRAGRVLRHALGDDGVSRLGERTFGAVTGGPTGPHPAAAAATALAALRTAGYRATSGWATNESGESAVSTWWRAEDALALARGGSGPMGR